MWWLCCTANSGLIRRTVEYVLAGRRREEGSTAVLRLATRESGERERGASSVLLQE